MVKTIDTVNGTLFIINATTSLVLLQIFNLDVVVGVCVCVCVYVLVNEYNMCLISIVVNY